MIESPPVQQEQSESPIVQHDSDDSIKAPSFSPISCGSSMDTLSPSCVVDMSVSSESSESYTCINSDTQSSIVSDLTSATAGSGATRPLSFEHVLIDAHCTSANLHTQPTCDLPPPSMPDVLVGGTPDVYVCTPCTSPHISNACEVQPAGHTCSTLPLPVITATNEATCLPTFKLIGDNLDKAVKPREEVGDTHKQTLHYFQSYAVRDRIDLSKCEDAPSLPDLQNANVKDVLPTEADNTSLKQNFVSLTSKIVHRCMPYFKKQIGVLEPIPCEYSKEMSKKSNVVCDYIHFEYC